jgi:hypothetical protein
MIQLLQRLAGCLILFGCLSAWGSTVWLADRSQLYAVDTAAQGAFTAAQGVSPSMLAAAADGTIWVVSEPNLLRLESDGRVRAVLDLAQIGIHQATALVVDPHDDSLWIASSGNRLLHLSAQGLSLGSIDVPQTALAMALAEDQSIWVLGERQLTHYRINGDRLQSLGVDLRRTTSAPQMVVDSIGGLLWIANSEQVVRADPVSGNSVTVLTAPESIVGQALDHKGGFLWVLNDHSLLAFSDQGERIRSIDLAVLGIDAASAIALDPTDGSLWFAHNGEVSSLSATGKLLSKSKIGGNANKVVTLPFWILPHLTLLEPDSGSMTADSQPTFRVGIDALCSGLPCNFTSDFGKSFKLFTWLNRTDVSHEVFRELITGEASFRPREALPDGIHRFDAVALDDFGHMSNWIETDIHVAANGPTAIGPMQSTPIELKAKNVAPKATWNSPATGSNYLAGSNITLSANATDTDGTITKVEFYRAGTTLIGQSPSTTNPYTFVWTNVPVGTYTLTAKATDNGGATGTSTATITINVNSNSGPAVSISSPADGAVFTAGSNVTINFSATDSEGTVTALDLYDGTTPLQHFPGNNTATLAASYAYNNIAPGPHAIKAVATDNLGATGTKTITIGSNRPPMVVLILPAACSVYDSPATFNSFTANAYDLDGTITKVEFYQNNTLLGIADQQIGNMYTRNAPWANVPSGTYTMTAKAYDNRGAVTTSTPITFFVAPANVPPTVSITSPANNAVIPGPFGNFTITAAANDPDGTITSVSFYTDRSPYPIGGAVLTNPPFTLAVGSFSPGSYRLFARAKDNRNAVTESNSVFITVTPGNPPAVSVTTPSSGATVHVGQATTLVAHATDVDGTITGVFFDVDGQQVGQASSSGGDNYTRSWTPTMVGSHTIVARAYDNSTLMTQSAAVQVMADNNVLPSVSITAPTTNAVYFAPATIRLTATATDSDGSIQNVTFLDNGAAVQTINVAPYTWILDNVGAGTHLITAIATDDRGGQTTSAAVSVLVNSGANLDVDAGIDASTVGDTFVYVAGTVAAPQNSGIAINGQLASFDRATGRFHAVVPISAGSNSLAVNLVTEDGQSANKTLIVTSSGTQPGMFTSDVNYGFAPAQVTFTVEILNGLVFQAAEFDMDGSGAFATIFQASALSYPKFGISRTYSQPGVYVVSVRLRNAAGIIVYQAKQVVELTAANIVDGFARAIWSRMNDALIVGNIAKAKVYLSDSARSNMADALDALSGSFAQIVATYSDPRTMSNDLELVELTVRRNLSGINAVFIIQFTLDSDGVWRLDSM